MFASTSSRDEGKILVFQDGKLAGIVENDDDVAFNLPGKKFAFYIGDDVEVL
jgi:hypothetical protein